MLYQTKDTSGNAVDIIYKNPKERKHVLISSQRDYQISADIDLILGDLENKKQKSNFACKNNLLTD